MTAKTVLFIGAALALTGACSRRSAEPAGSATTTAGLVVPPDDAISRVTNSRCDREAACNNVGAGKKFADRDACNRELSHNTHPELRSEQCPRGIDENRLQTCLSEIQDERCGNPIDTIDRMANCRRGKLCIGD
jgi:hypothetical protein